MSVSLATYFSTITFFLGILFILVVVFRRPTPSQREELDAYKKELLREMNDQMVVHLQLMVEQKESIERMVEEFREKEQEDLQKSNIGLVAKIGSEKWTVGEEKKKAIISLSHQGYLPEVIGERWDLPVNVIVQILEEETNDPA